MLFVIVLSPLGAACQAQRRDLPNAPEPVPTQSSAPAPLQAPPANPPMPDREWRKIQSIVHGEAVIVASTYGPPLRCLFASATDDALFCNAASGPDGVGYRLERATVIYIELETPRVPPNHHPVWLSCMITGGILTGLAATHVTDAGYAAGLGAAGAVIVAAIGAPMALSSDNGGPPRPVILGSRSLIRIPVRSPRIPHRLLQIHP